MNFPWLIAPAWVPLLHALLHTLWQGALAAGVSFAALHVIPVQHARLRYSVAVTTLGMILLAGAGTWLLLARSGADLEMAHRAESAVPPTEIVGGQAWLGLAMLNSPQPAGEPWICWAAGGWLSGVTVCLIRVTGGLSSALNLKRRSRDWTDPNVVTLLDQLRAGLGLAQRVRVFVSSEIRVPAVLGIFRPVILLPAAMLTGMTQEVLRAVLAHELAHVRRHDYLVNLAQMVVESLLFFNPFVWLISRQIRCEREACCDQMAAGACPSAASYVQALVAVIARCRQPAGEVPIPLLAVVDPNRTHGRTDGLLERIRRLLVPGHHPALQLRWLHGTVTAAILGTGLLAWWMGAPKRAPSVFQTLFANVRVRTKRLQVLVEEYPSGRKVLTVVNSHPRQAPPTPVSALQVRLFSNKGTEVPCHPVLGETEAMIPWDQGWHKRIMENSQYDLGNANLTDLREVQLDFHSNSSARIKLRDLRDLKKGVRGVLHFHEKDFVYHQATLRLYSVQWTSSTKRRANDVAYKPHNKNEVHLPKASHNGLLCVAHQEAGIAEALIVVDAGFATVADEF